MAGKINNFFLVNAPAGSGKTTHIKAMVRNILSSNPNNNILCITYTNRAADELAKEFTSKNVFVGTIHSFMHSFMKRYFEHPDVLNLFFEVYGDKIKERIANSEHKDTINESNKNYIEKYGELNYDIVKENIKAISYNETSFNSLYYGGLSHDDLISFSKLILDRYPAIQKRISFKYQYVFIDEYQDTMADVLKIFYNSLIDTNCQLYLFGDRMQQIYKNYDGSFEEQFRQFDTTKSLTINYRSSFEIVGILNKIYNDTSFLQDNSEEMKQIVADFKPRVIVSSDIQKSVENIKRDIPNTLVLFLLNKNRFIAIGAQQLYHAYSNMSKYSFGKAYSSVNVLTTPYEDNPDALLVLLYCLIYMAGCYKKKQYGLVIQTLKSNKSIFNKARWDIKNHSDKQKLYNDLAIVFSCFESETATVSDLLQSIKNISLVNEVYMEEITNDDDYDDVLKIPVIESVRVYQYLSNPTVSTQHGVKGESHDSVVFVADNSSSDPVVHMYRFFEMWGEISVSIKEFNSFYYNYTKELLDLFNIIKIKIRELNSGNYSNYKDQLLSKTQYFLERFNDNPYFNFLCKDQYITFLTNPTLTNAKKCFKESDVFGVLSAYKLFYVGCSRARKNLTILLERSKIKGKFEQQINKFKQLGFIIQQE